MTEPDWPKPAGCHCPLLAQARGCENRCDDSMWERANQAERWSFLTALLGFVLGCCFSFFVYAVARGVT